MARSRSMNRRTFLSRSAGLTALGALVTPTFAQTAAPPSPPHPLLEEAIAKLPATILTPQDEFYNVERGNPLPYKLPLEKRREVGLERETWTLDVFADDGDKEKNIAPTKLGHPMTKAAGNAFTFADLMRLAETKAVRFLKLVTCNNLFAPLGLGVWEGVPLRDVLWLARPKDNYRQVYYDGYHNEDPKQLFQCWLPANRVLEEPPGFLPVILCYKINGQWLTGERGGPVRMVVPEAYGFKSVKWIKRVIVTNKYQPEDTYALQNNDVNDSWMKTRALFGDTPGKVKAQSPFAITGQAQVGIGGLAKVQWWAQPAEHAWPAEDEHFTKAPWKDAQILPLHEKWKGDAEVGPLHPAQFDARTGRPVEWPMRYTWCHWAALVPGLKAGKYILRCRSIDLAGNAQPLPRPYRKSGRAEIHSVNLVAEA
ncbi:MAG: molybdopterin-dependent oxidoreductase [Phycisphaeraceae bacterium]